MKKYLTVSPENWSRSLTSDSNCKALRRKVLVLGVWRSLMGGGRTRKFDYSLIQALGYTPPPHSMTSNEVKHVMIPNIH